MHCIITGLRKGFLSCLLQTFTSFLRKKFSQTTSTKTTIPQQINKKNPQKNLTLTCLQLFLIFHLDPAQQWPEL